MNRKHDFHIETIRSHIFSVARRGSRLIDLRWRQRPRYQPRSGTQRDYALSLEWILEDVHGTTTPEALRLLRRKENFLVGLTELRSLGTELMVGTKK